MDWDVLNVREHKVLEAIIRNYILSAAPTSSRYISKLSGFDLSAASIRNVMGDLEERGFIEQPHTSAGRIPTDKGYRYFVDRLMKHVDLPEDIKVEIRRTLIAIDQTDMHLLMEAVSRALSKATSQLGVILAPKLWRGIFKQVYVFPIGSNRYLMHITIDSFFVKTMLIELETEVPQEYLEKACRVISDVFCGKKLREMYVSEIDKVPDLSDYENRLIRILIPSIRKVAENKRNENVYAEGETNVLLQPEFFDRERINSLIGILETKTLLMHLFETSDEHGEGNIVISIGDENLNGQLHSFSIIKTTYHVGSMVGSLGIIGPKRMPYPFLVSAVDYTARLLRELYT